jgi:putative transposase
VDFKGWWRTFRGEKCEPLTIRDEHSRYILTVKGLKDTKTETVKEEFERVFKIYGLPKVIRSDNGQPFGCTRAVHRLTKLSAWFILLGIQFNPIAPGHPQENGAHERMHRDMKNELEKNGINDQEAFDMWREEFNSIRPHEALQMKTPSDVYRKSDRLYPEGELKIEYSGEYQSRQVNKQGEIKVKNWHYAISSSLAGQNVGLKHISETRKEVWFDYLFLGEIDLKDRIFVRYDKLPT